MILQRKSDVFFCSLLLGVLLMGLIILDAAMSQYIDQKWALERQAVVKALGLTDLCLFTEARYTRHPSMADRYTPFQDHPLALDHFPSGAIMAVPPHLRPQEGGE
jgi:hypothetical protein